MVHRADRLDRGVSRAESAALRERRQTVDIETESVNLNDETQTEIPSQFGVRLNIHSGAILETEDESPELAALDPAKDVPAFLYGQRIRFAAKLREPRRVQA